MFCDFHKKSILNQIVNGIDESEESSLEPENYSTENDERGDFFDELEQIASLMA